MNKRLEHLEEKARCKFPFMALQLLVFSAPAKYRVVKIAHSSFEVIL
jgi:hypothetical protein